MISTAAVIPVTPSGEVAHLRGDAPAADSIVAGRPAACVLSFLLLSVYIGALIIATVSRNRIYENEVTLWKSVVDGTPSKRRPRMNYADALVTLGKQREDGRLYGEALRELQVLMALPDDGSSSIRNWYGETGLIYYRLGMPDEAMQLWREGLKHASGDAALENNIAIALLHQGRLDEALEHAMTARGSDPLMPKAVFTLGEIYYAKGEYLEAAGHFVMAEKLQPEKLDAYWNASLAFLEAGQYEMAYEQVVKYLERETDLRLRADARSLAEEVSGKLADRKRYQKERTR